MSGTQTSKPRMLTFSQVIFLVGHLAKVGIFRLNSVRHQWKISVFSVPVMSGLRKIYLPTTFITYHIGFSTFADLKSPPPYWHLCEFLNFPLLQAVEMCSVIFPVTPSCSVIFAGTTSSLLTWLTTSGRNILYALTILPVLHLIYVVVPAKPVLQDAEVLGIPALHDATYITCNMCTPWWCSTCNTCTLGCFSICNTCTPGCFSSWKILHTGDKASLDRCR